MSSGGWDGDVGNENDESAEVNELVNVNVNESWDVIVNVNGNVSENHNANGNASVNVNVHENVGESPWLRSGKSHS